MNLLSIPFLILIFIMICKIERDVNGQIHDDIRDATSVEMMPNHYQIVQAHRRLISLTSEDRGKLCLEKISQVKKHVFVDDRIHDLVLRPHKYKFDGSEIFLAIQCLTMPTIYIGVPIHGKIHPSQWYIRTMTSSKKYNFTLEAASELTAAGDMELRAFADDESKRKMHIFRRLEKKEFWYICNAAEKVIQYEPQWNGTRVDKPQIYTYSSGGFSETYLTILCPTNPVMYIHAGEAGVGDEFTIVFRRNELESMKVKFVDE